MVEEVINQPQYLQGLSINSEGRTAIASSNFIGRLWDGAVCIFKEAELAPSLNNVQCSTTQTHGCTDVQWVDGAKLLVASDSGAVELLQTDDSKHLKSVWMPPVEHHDVCSSVSLFSDKKQFVSGGWDGLVKVWDFDVADTSINTVRLHSDRVHQVQASPLSPDLYMTASEDRTIKLYDNRADRPASTLHTHKLHFPTTIGWCSEALLLAGFSDGSVILLDRRNTASLISVRQLHGKSVNGMLVQQDMFFTCSDDLSVKAVEYSTASIEGVIYDAVEHGNYVKGIACSKDSGVLWSCGWDGKVVGHNTSRVKSMDI